LLGRSLCRCPERRRHRRATKQRDELSTSQVIELHSVPSAKAGSQHIELVAISQQGCPQHVGKQK